MRLAVQVGTCWCDTLCRAVPLLLLRLLLLLCLLLCQGLTPEEIDAFMAQQAAKQQQEDGEA